MRYTFLTGGYALPDEPGVCRVSYDTENGFELEAAGRGYTNPSYVLPGPDGRRFYAVEETAAGAVRAGVLGNGLDRRPGGVDTRGADPCHLCLSGDGRRLYAANYTSGSLAVCALDGDGNLAGEMRLIEHAGRGPHPTRQEGPHVHFSAVRDGVVYVCDLGLDAIAMYRDDGTLAALGRVPLPPGSGPRHLAFSPVRPNCMYCVAELSNQVFALEGAGADWRVVQALPTLPGDFAGESTAAAIRFTEDGAVLLASNRGHDSVAAFPVDPDGGLRAPVISPCVAQPRDFLPCGDRVLVASQRDSEIRAYRLDIKTLRLAPTDHALSLPHPVCLARLW